MGNSTAYPLLTTTNVDALVTLAERLLTVAEGDGNGDGITTELYVRVPGREQLRRLLAAVPDAEVTTHVRADAAEPGDHPLPFDDIYSLALAVPPENAVATARAVLEFCPHIQLTWESFGWPAIPELGHHHPLYNYAAVVIAFHHHDVYLAENPTPGHTLFLHADSHEDRAEWLAHRAGAEITGLSSSW
ncbi:hypothetical protein [Streptomyces sp. NPDC091371]|uniref:hypothetical protein n=1 Tax=Streptomyces sp. NPDC091371 TaxID=3155303 RepID=UPI003425D5C7